MPGGDGDAVVAGVENMVVFRDNEAGVAGWAIAADAIAEHDPAAAVTLLGRLRRVAAANDVVVDAQRTARCAAGHVDADIVLNPAALGLVDHLVPRDFRAGELPHLVELRELYEVKAVAVAALPVAVPAVDVARCVADDANGLLVGAIAFIVQKIDAGGIFQCAVFNGNAGEALDVGEASDAP